MFWLKKPKISVVVLVDRMQREAPRTLYSLSTAHQRGVKSSDYEVIVVERPSQQMLRPAQVRKFGRNFRHVVHPGDANSSSAAMNFGASLARGQHLTMMIDGAGILSPGILQRSIAATQIYDHSVVATLAWHLGPDIPSRSIPQGYCQDAEDRLLESVHWRDDGYRLFDISWLAASCRDNWFGPILESNCMTVDREHYAGLGGFCEEFRTGRDGWANRDFFRRATADSSRRTVLVLGEGTFQQFHDRAVADHDPDESNRKCREEYQRIRGEAYSAPTLQPILFGHMPAVAKRLAKPALLNAASVVRSQLASMLLPVGTAADQATSTPDASQDDLPRKVA